MLPPLMPILCLLLSHILPVSAQGEEYIYETGFPAPTPFLPNHGDPFAEEEYEYHYLPDLTCEQRASCAGRELLFLSAENIAPVNCFCDEMCQVYDDCCTDFQQTAYNQHLEALRLKRGSFSCRHMEGIGGGDLPVYVVDSCPKEYNNDYVTQSCQQPPQTDMFDNIPVSGVRSGILYRNYHCAVCNSEPDFTFWKVNIGCGTDPGLELQDGAGLSVEDTIATLLSQPDNDCELEFQAVAYGPRYCKRSVISRCHTDWSDKKLKRACRASKSTAYKYAYQRIFRNDFCAECNYVNASYLTCEDKITPVPKEKDIERDRPRTLPPLSLLLDINFSRGNVRQNKVGMFSEVTGTEVTVQMRQCAQDHVYDPFNRLCRQVRCKVGQVFHEGECRENPYPPETSLGDIPAASTASAVATEDTSPAHTTTTPPEFVFVPPTEAPPVQYKTTTSFYDYLATERNKKRKGSSTGRDSSSGDEEELYYVGEGEEGYMSLNCPFISIAYGEYELLADGSVYIASYSRSYGRHEYVNDTAVKGDIFVCMPDSMERNYTMTSNTSHVDMFKFDRIQGLVSYIGLLISIVCLFVVFVIYMIYPVLRNIAGRCTVCLVVALLLAQVVFMVSGPLVEYELACFILAVLLHYCYLAAFCWMNVLSIDIYKVLSSNAPQNEDESNRFIYYSLYAWLSPAVVVGGSLALEFLPGDLGEWRPLYGDGFCWISQRWPLIAMFAAPVAIILIVNIILFILTTVKICLIDRAARYLHTNKRDTGRLVLYIKLCFIMGLMWVFGFAAALTEITALWYVFILFNTLQGAFICFAFVCTRRVFRLLSGRGEDKKKPTNNNGRVGGGYYSSNTNRHLGNNHVTDSWNDRTKQTVLDTSYNGDAAKIVESRETSI